MNGERRPDRALQVMNFVAALGQVASTEQFVAVALEGLFELIPADLWGFNDIDPHSKDLVASIYPQVEFLPEMYDAVQRVVWQHPVLQRMAATGDGSPKRLSDFWSREEYHRTELYRAAYRHIGVEYQVSFMLSDGPTASALGFAANRSERDFTDDELALLQQLRPALLSAWQRGSASGALMEIVGKAEDRPLVLVDSRARVVTAHPAAAAMLRRGGVELAEGDRIPEPLAGWLSRDARRSEQPLLVGSRHQVSVTLVAGSPDAERVLAIESIVADDPSALLSKRERDVLDAVAEGATDAEIAEDLGISKRTVQKHLERIYTKLGVSNRVAAVRATGR